MQPPSNSEADKHYKSGMELKANGQPDAALTEFRRAVILDPNHFNSQLEIGFQCRVKAKTDRTFLRYALEAFRKAARLDRTNETAHNQYIMVGQQMGLLDELHAEYATLAKNNPDNALLQQCNKNIITLSMAMMPQGVSVGDSGASPLRKIFLIASLICLFLGLGTLIASPALLKAGKISKEQVSSMARTGMVMSAAGVVGFIVRSKIS